MKGRTTVWQPSGGNGRWVKWKGSILRANQHFMFDEYIKGQCWLEKRAKRHTRRAYFHPEISCPVILKITPVACRGDDPAYIMG